MVSTPYQARKARAINSGPLSDRICVGQPRIRNSALKTSCTSREVSRRRTAIARYSRVYSSTTVSSFNGRPSCVRSITKSCDLTWFGYSDRFRMQAPSVNQSRTHFGCFFGTFKPSCRQICSTRWWFTRHPSWCNSAVIHQ